MEGRQIPCPACGAELELKLEKFPIGADGGGGLMSLLMEQYDVDLYACPRCGKVELYTAGFREEDGLREEPEEPNGEEPEESASPGGGLFGLGRKKDRRPPWEK